MMSALALKATESHKDSEFGPIPEDWELLEAFNFHPYITSGSRGWAQHYSDSGAPFIRIGNLSHDDIYPDLRDLRHVNVNADDPEAIRTRLEVGDILISITADIGAIGYIGAEIPRPAYINQHIACLRLPSEKIDSRFVAYFLSSSGPQRRFSAMVDVGAKSGLNLTTIGKLKLLVPPLNEQRGIAAALSDADALIEGLESLIAKKRAIKQAAMQELLSGRRRLAGFSGEWLETTLGQLGKCLRGVSYDPNRDLYSFDTASTARLLRSNNVQDSKIVLSDMQYVHISRVSEDKYLRQNDILVCMANGSRDLVGKAGRFYKESDGLTYTFGAFMGCFRPSETAADATFTYYIFNTDQYKSHISLLLAGSAINNLSPGNIEALPIRVPVSRDEQAAIAHVLTEMDAELEALTERLSKAHHIKQGMMQELLTGRVRLV